ncbi:hypothetical protein [Oceanobacillus damuensis]|uniref:hypothetical protein n=1 Tax=Oceanobacillus damuensis TaxID=937928 RepID=UPI000832C65A|nr:hypothetical protein [Oceanobacillus damuensis]
MSKNSIERGQSITFRVPSDTPDYLLKQLQNLKETERRNFSSKIAGFVLKGVNETFVKEKETVTIPLPKQLTKEQRSWLKHEHSEALIGSILYHLLNDPMRATTLLAALNSNTSNINEALYLQEETNTLKEKPPKQDMDLDDFSLDGLNLHEEETVEEEEDEDPLGDFFSSMNK